jgi:predicted permease
MFISLFRAVLILFLMMVPGYIMRKMKLASDGLPLGFTNTILYITQPAMLVVGFFRARDMEILKTAGFVMLLSFVTHIMFIFAVKLFYRGAEKETAKVYRFGTVFANAGYMGIPLISMVLGDEAAIYASVYIVAFNFFCWSYGALIYSEDKSFISPKKMFVNAATIPTAIGIIIFVTNVYPYIPAPIADLTYETLTMLKNTVAPMSMMIIGMRLADLNLKGAFRDKYLYLGLSLRLIVFPLGAFVLLAICKLLGFYDPTGFTVILVCASTPVASATCMFAEKFGSDSTSASKFVSVSTVLSLATMPLMALLLDVIPLVPSLI